MSLEPRPKRCATCALVIYYDDEGLIERGGPSLDALGLLELALDASLVEDRDLDIGAEPLVLLPPCVTN